MPPLSDSRRGTTTTDTEASTVCRAAVVGTDHRIHLPGGLISTATVRPSDILTILAGTVSMADHCTIVVDGATVADHAAHVDTVRRSGWAVTQVGPWTLYRRDGRTCAVGLRDEFGPAHLGSLIHRGDDPGVLATLLHRYAELVGMSWRGTAATTAFARIRLTWENARETPLWHQIKTGPGYASGPLVYHRSLTRRERWWGYVHTFDAASAYLGSMINAELAWSGLTHTGRRTFDRHVPGYWLCELSAATLAWCADPSLPPIVPPARIRDGQAWLTTPMVDLLYFIGEPPAIVDSWTARERGGRRGGYRILRTFGEQLRDARAAAARDSLMAERLVYALKRTYKDAVGGMQREGMRIYRPDWAHTIIDTWRATIIRRILSVHERQRVWPVRVMTDSLSYPDSGGPAPRGATAALGEPTLTDSLSVAVCEVPGCCCAGPTQPEIGPLGTYKHTATVTTRAWEGGRG